MKNKFVILGLVATSIFIALFVWNNPRITKVANQEQINQKDNRPHSAGTSSKKEERKKKSIISNSITNQTSNSKDANFEITFEDSNISPDLSKKISDDISLVFEHLYIDSSRKTNFRDAGIQGKENLKTEIYFINFGGIGRYIPREVSEEFKWAIKQDDELHPLVTTKLSDLYKEKYNFISYYPNVITKLDKFIENMNKVTSSNKSELRNLFYEGNLTNQSLSALRAFTEEDIRKSYGDKIYRKPSIFELTEVPEEIKKSGGELMAPTYLQVKNGISDLAPPIIYADGQWKIYISEN